LLSDFTDGVAWEFFRDPRIIMRPTPAAKNCHSNRFSKKALTGAAFLRPAGLIAVVALALATPDAWAEFRLTVSFGSGLSSAQQTAVQNAADYWNTQITGYKTGVTLTGFNIQVDAVNDSWASYLAYAGPDSTTVQQGTKFTTAGSSSINIGLYGTGTTFMGSNELTDVMKHEFGHTLGIGTLWEDNGLYDYGTGRYTGANALAGWRDEFNRPDDTFVPVEQAGGSGTADGHWDEVYGGGGPTGFVSNVTGRDFEFELMTGWANTPTFTSSVTLGTLMDLGYVIGVPTNADGDYIVQAGSIRATMTGAHKMFKQTGGTATIFSANDYTGGSILQEGKLIIGDVSALGTGSITVAGATLDVATFNISAPTFTLESGSVIGTTGSIAAAAFDLQSGDVSARLAGDGAVTKTTDGTVTLSSANTYKGGTVVQAGKLVVAHSAALSNGAVSVSGGTLDIGATNVVGIGAVTLLSGSITGSTGSLNAKSFDLRSGSVAATLAGNGAVTKTTSGTVILSSANTFAGGTTVSAGTLVAAHARALSTGAVTVSSGGTLDIAADVVAGVVVLDSGTISGSAGSLTASSLEVRSGTVSAAIAGATSITKTTTGTVTLSGTSSHTGGTTVSAGTLVAVGSFALGAGDVHFSAAGSRLVLAHENAAAKSTLFMEGGLLSFGQLTTVKVGQLTGSSGLVLQNDSAAPVALSVGDTSSSTYSGAISGNGSFIKTGSGKLVLSGVSTYAGGTTIAKGTLEVGTDSALGTGAITVAGGNLDLGSRNVAVGGAVVLQSGTIKGVSGSLSGSSYELQSGTVSAKLIGSGALTKTTEGVVTLNSANTYSGGTTVLAGKLAVSNSAALGSGSVRVAGGQLDILKAVSGVSSVVLESGSITGPSTISATSFDLRSGTVSARLTGSGSVTKSTSGTVTLSAANTYSGGTTVAEGTLVVTNVGALGTGATQVNSGGVLRVADGASFGSTWSGADIAMSGGSIEFGLTSNNTVTRAITGTGNVVQNGTGTLTLTNAEYTGQTTVNAGRLIVSAAHLPGGTLFVSGSGTLEIAGDGGTHDFSGDVAGTGSLALTGSGATRIHGALSQTGALSVTSGHTLSLGSSDAETVSLATSLLTIGSGGTLRGSGSIAGSLRNAGRLTPGFSPGTITIAGDFTNIGTLDMEIAASGAHDQIRFGGQAFLGGTLNIIFLGGAPTNGTLINLFVDTDTTDGRPSLVGNFAAVNIPAGAGVLFNSGSSFEFLVGGTLADIPGANISRRLIPLARALTAASATNPVINAVASPINVPVATLGNVLRGASTLGFAALAELPVAEASRDVDELRRHLDGRRFERPDSAGFDFSPYVSGNGMKVISGKGDDAAAFDYHTFGGMIGVDKGVGGDLVVGVQVSYDSGTANFHGGFGKVEQDRAHVLVYGSRLFANRYYVDAGFFGGMSSFDTRRQTEIGRETAGTRGWDAGAFTNVGTIVPFSPVLSLAPHAGFAYTHAKTGEFTERGDDFALRVSDSSYGSLSSRLGATLNWKTELGDSPLRIGFDTSFVHELLDNEQDITADFISTPVGGFTTSTVVRPCDKIMLGPELDLQVADGQSITVSYKFEYAFGDATGHRFDVGYRARF
jgi:autotransporter-associated beta strand protein